MNPFLIIFVAWQQQTSHVALKGKTGKLFWREYEAKGARLKKGGLLKVAAYEISRQQI